MESRTNYCRRIAVFVLIALTTVYFLQMHIKRYPTLMPKPYSKSFDPTSKISEAKSANESENTSDHQNINIAENPIFQSRPTTASRESNPRKNGVLFTSPSPSSLHPSLSSSLSASRHPSSTSKTSVPVQTQIPSVFGSELSAGGQNRTSGSNAFRNGSEISSAKEAVALTLPEERRGSGSPPPPSSIHSSSPSSKTSKSPSSVFTSPMAQGVSHALTSNPDAHEEKIPPRTERQSTPTPHTHTSQGMNVDKAGNCKNCTIIDVNKESPMPCQKCDPDYVNEAMAGVCKETCLHRTENGENAAQCETCVVKYVNEQIQECLTKPWITVYKAGRLGNQICEYAHLMLMRIEYGAKDIKLKGISYEKLDTQFPLNFKQSSAINGYPCNIARLWKYRDLWRQEFIFTEAIQRKNRQRIKESLEKWRHRQKDTGMSNTSVSPVVIGVHVRRTDYIVYLNNKYAGKIPSLKYYKNAFNYYRERFKHVAFIISSDDRTWCRKNLESQHQDAIVSSPGTFEEDLGLLASTSHVVMSVGTFGMWAGLLANGSITFPYIEGKKRPYFMTTNLKLLNSPDLIAIKDS